jgi:RHS repeat-associated protein
MNKNLPTQINFGKGNKIEYLYDATGQKVAKTVKADNSSQKTTDYLSGFQYKNEVLLFFPTAEGYVDNTVLNENNNYSYVYNYSDHLGNIRLNYAKDPKTQTLRILEQNHYYPFGLKHENYSSQRFVFVKDDLLVEAQQAVTIKIIGGGGGGVIVYGENKYKYNGFELQDELELNWYDYKARNYDPALGRWMNVDPLAELSRRYSPYSHALNNPIFFIDQDEMDEEGFDRVNWGLQGAGAKNITKA